MHNTVFVILGAIALLIIFAGFIAYAINTTRIIKEQEKEIAHLRTSIKRYKQRGTLYIEKNGRIPDFGDF